MIINYKIKLKKIVKTLNYLIKDFNFNNIKMFFIISKRLIKNYKNIIKLLNKFKYINFVDKLNINVKFNDILYIYKTQFIN